MKIKETSTENKKWKYTSVVLLIALSLRNKTFKSLVYKLPLILFIFFVAPTSLIAIANLEDSAVTHDPTSDTTFTVSGIVPAGTKGTNRFGIVKLGYFTNTTVVSVVWGGVDITANVIKSAAHDISNRKTMAWFYYLNPPASSADVNITLGANSAKSAIVEAWSSVDQVTPYGDLTVTTDNTSETANPAVKTITATAGKVVTDNFFMWTSGGAGTTWSLGGDQTQIEAGLANFGGGANTGFFGSSYATSDGSVDMTWDTNHPATNQWAMYIISLTEASLALPTATTNFATPGFNAASLNGTKTSGPDGTEHGFAYGTDSTLGTAATTTLGALSGNHAFSSHVVSLSANTTYYFRAYVENAAGTGYGVIKSFTTGNSTATRNMRLFDKLKFIDGKIILHQQ